MKAWLKGWLMLFVVIFLIIQVDAAILPPGPYCEHMGYNISIINETSYCVFDENNSCPTGEFYFGKCGEEFVKEFPCREMGEFVYSQFEKCCEGKPFIRHGIVGDRTCEPFHKRLIVGLLANMMFNPFYWVAEGIVFLILISYVIHRLIKKEIKCK